MIKIIVVSLLLLSSHCVLAQPPDDNFERKLVVVKQISAFAREHCVVPIDGRTKGIAAEVKVEFSKLLKRLVDLGFAIRFKDERTAGIAQRDVAKALRVREDCESRIFEIFDVDLRRLGPPIYRWEERLVQEDMKLHYGSRCDSRRWNCSADKSQSDKKCEVLSLECNEATKGQRVVKARRQRGDLLLELKPYNAKGFGYGVGFDVLISDDRKTIHWHGAHGTCHTPFTGKAPVHNVYECVKKWYE